MNLLFALILLVAGIVFIVTNPAGLLPALIAGGANGVAFALKLIPIYAVWLTALKVLERGGVDKNIARIISPVTKRLFPRESETAYTYINLNLSANLLGMGGASTPLGIKAVENMTQKKNKVMLIVINSTSITLIPTTIISLRASAGGTADIILPALITTFATTFVGILLVKIFQKQS